MSESSAPLPATIAAPVVHELVIRKSRFIAQVVPVSSPGDPDEVIAAARRRYWDARHNCTAQVTGLHAERARSSDDGEPSGTAGAPMLEVLRRRGLTDVVAVVTRYFGGVKLGAGGLIRAYSSATSEALDRARLVDRTPLVKALVSVPHAEAGRFDNLLRVWVEAHRAVLDETRYDARAVFSLWVPDAALEQLDAELAAASAGAITAARTGERRVLDVPR
ncbi:IMPACT family protein [Microbacterium sp. USHLN186]|uniref:IMPACT family protein n=1 Tax=Microbacterium sp. USHLN186 TaxID=3081286 RepID=UPI0030190232